MTEARVCPGCRVALPSDAPEDLCPKCLWQQAFQEPPGTGPWPEDPGATPSPGRFIPPAAAAMAEHFPGLEILGLLGQGGMGAVYVARQTKLDRLVALKIMTPELSGDPAFAQRFGREARALARLNHPNIVAIHDYGEAAGLYFFLMEYVEGCNARQLLRAGPLEPHESLKIVTQLCDALQYAHEEEIVHRDVKPENILLDKRGRVKIADFGLAKLVGRAPADFTLTGSRQVMGTPHYMAPEQLEKPHTVDHRADLYSLGVVFYELLTGELPLGRFAAPSQKASVDPRLDAIVLRALEKDPDKRYQQAGAIRSDVRPLVGSERDPHGGNRLSAEGEGIETELIGDRLILPAAGLILTAVLNVFTYLFVCLVVSYSFSRSVSGLTRDLLNAFGTGYGFLLFCGSLLIIWGATRMLQLRSYRAAIITTILAMFPLSLGFPLGVVCGLYALRALRRPDVRLAFARRAVTSAGPGQPTQPAAVVQPGEARPAPGGIASFFRAFRSAFISGGSRVNESSRGDAAASAAQAEVRSRVRTPSPSPRKGPPTPTTAEPPPAPRSDGQPPIAAAAPPAFVSRDNIMLATVLAAFFVLYGFALFWVDKFLWMFGLLVLLPMVGLFTLVRWLMAMDLMKAAATEDSVLVGLSGTQQEIRGLLKQWQDNPNAPQVSPEIDGEALAAARTKTGVPPGERILGLIDFSADYTGDQSNVLLFGCDAIYYLNPSASPRPGPGTLPYSEFAQRTFVNQGRAVYLGEGEFIYTDPEWDGIDCEDLANLLNCVREFCRTGADSKTGRRAEGDGLPDNN